jgi:hypothetical protein
MYFKNRFRIKMLVCLVFVSIFLHSVGCFSCANLLHSFRIPHTPFASGVHYIHSPELFLPTHGLCGPGFSIEQTNAPIRTGDYDFISFSYRSLWEGRMHARVFSSSATMSHFLIVDSDGTPCVMGHLRLSKIEKSGGFALRCFASRLRPAGFWDMVLGGNAFELKKEQLESIIAVGARAETEDPNLKNYRRRVLYGL